jgi:hypothetical protein
MRVRLSHGLLGVFAAAAVLAAPAARAFTVENKDAASQYTVPKFDLEEQSKNFTKGSSTTTTPANKNMFETPLGDGKLQFGIVPGGASNFGMFGSGLGSASDSARSSRQEFDRRLAPPSSLDYNSPR